MITFVPVDGQNWQFSDLEGHGAPGKTQRGLLPGEVVRAGAIYDDIDVFCLSLIQHVHCLPDKAGTA